MLRIWVQPITRVYKNNSNIINNIMGAFLIKGGSMIISLLTMPAYISYFDNQTVLGVWFTILSMLNWVLSFDLGIGNGLRNKLTLAIVKNDKINTRKYISSAYIMIGFLSVTASIVSFFIFPKINWNTIFNVNASMIDADTLLYCLRIIFVGLIIQFFLRQINSILYSLQKSSINNLLALLSNIIILCFVLIPHQKDIKQSIILLSYINILAVNLPLLITTFIVFSTVLKESKPSVYYFKSSYAKSIISMGFIFFFLQLASVIIISTNEFLISHFVGTPDVVEYQAYFRIFNLCSSIFNLALTPIWSAVTKALGEHNIRWITKLYKTICIISIISSLLMFLLVPILPTIIRLWLGNGFTIYTNYSIAFVLLSGLMIWNAANSVISNGLGKLKAQLIFLSLGAVLNIPLAYLFTNINHEWIMIIWANIVSMFPICIIQPIYLKRELKNLKSSSSCSQIEASCDLD